MVEIKWQRFLVVENCSFIPKPLIFPFEENAILFFEPVEIAILHTLDQHYGVYLGADELFFGQYQTNGDDIELILNDWMKKGFTAEKKSYFWKLYGKFERVV